MRKAVLIALLVCAVVVPLAHADGDPASDWLLQRLLFVPPDAGISSGDQKQLQALLQDAHRQGYTVHVAVIPSRYDMGSVTVLTNRPTLYAPFLSQEMKFFYKGRVLVVMPKGIVIARDGARDPKEQKAIAKIKPPAVFKGAALATTTEAAIRALAANAGIQVKAQPIAKSGSSTNEDRLVIVGAAVLLALIAAAVTWWRRRAARTPRRKR